MMRKKKRGNDRDLQPTAARVPKADETRFEEIERWFGFRVAAVTSGRPACETCDAHHLPLIVVGQPPAKSGSDYGALLPFTVAPAVQVREPAPDCRSSSRRSHAPKKSHSDRRRAATAKMPGGHSASLSSEDERSSSTPTTTSTSSI
jgi:hypothetical protein